MKSNKKVMLVGGGTGGHLLPILDIYQNLKKYKEIDTLIIGSNSSFDKLFLKNNLDHKIITTGKINRSLTFKNVVELLKSIVGIVEVFSLFILNKPDLVFSKGGFVSFPVIFWSKILRVPYFIHESDIEMGLSNKYAAKKAKKVFVGFPIEFYRGYNNLNYTGQIIKQDEPGGSENFFEFLGKKTTIFITGGSQGSLNINKNITKIVPSLLKSYNIIHQTGQSDFDWIKAYRDKLDQELKSSYYVTDNFSRDETDMISEAINYSELVIARAGANTIAEISIRKKAMILIPYKHAAGDHQNKNAEFVSSHGGALVIKDDELLPKLLLEKINEALKDSQNLSENAYKLFPKNGLKIVVRAILNQINIKD